MTKSEKFWKKFVESQKKTVVLMILKRNCSFYVPLPLVLKDVIHYHIYPLKNKSGSWVTSISGSFQS